jgi:predicted phosphoribosyltransferase
MLFHDRTYAAFLLINQLKQYKNCGGVVLAVPEGGVPIGYQISRLLNLSFDLIFCKKIGHPTNPEFAIGAVSEDMEIIDPVNCVGVSPDYISKKAWELKREMASKRNKFMMDQPSISLTGKVVILTDDGIATGNTVLACIKSIRKQKPKKIIVAVPVTSPSAYNLLSSDVDEFINLLIPRHLNRVSEFYENFHPVNDNEVVRVLAKIRAEKAEKFLHSKITAAL